MAKSIKLTARRKSREGVKEKSVFFNSDNILYYEGFTYEGNSYTTITLLGTTSDNHMTYNVVESPEDIHKLINQ
ncbi:hypothetical protein [Sphingobacterium multivorum]|uniref:hypothetical protein n=1 Tax=Sphingobacterium multivorum TaxID=28454 RepID=UPI0028A03986|nr:hypothetical protein [Sphingobacterium multivorum]